MSGITISHYTIKRHPASRKPQQESQSFRNNLRLRATRAD